MSEGLWADPPPRSAWRFLLLAVASSWAVWGVVVLAGPSLPHAVNRVLLMAGFAAVALAAVVAVGGRRDTYRSRAFWLAATDGRRIPAAGWLAAVLLMPALACAAALVDALVTGVPLESGELLQSVSRPLALLRILGFALLAGPILEELGWRGVALAPLQRRHGALAGATLLGCVHALWHLPLFVAADGYFHSLGLLTPAFWRFMADILVFDLLAAAVFNFANASTLAAIVFHCSFNAAGTLWVLTPAAGLYRDLLAALAAGLVVLGTRGRLFLAEEGRPAVERAPAS